MAVSAKWSHSDAAAAPLPAVSSRTHPILRPEAIERRGRRGGQVLKAGAAKTGWGEWEEEKKGWGKCNGLKKFIEFSFFRVSPATFMKPVVGYGCPTVLR
jgi:hypothetical protein